MSDKRDAIAIAGAGKVAQALGRLLILIAAVVILSVRSNRFLTTENILNQGRLLSEIWLLKMIASHGFCFPY